MSGRHIEPLSWFVTTTLDHYGHIRHKRNVVQLAAISLPTKGAARSFIKAIKDAAPLETPLPDEFTPILLAMLDWHPSRDEKLQYGCRGFLVRINPPAFKPTDRGFWIITERPPPEIVSFSYIKCFTGDDTPASKPYNRLSQAARAATIQSQIDFKRRHFMYGMLCPRCGNGLTPETAQVDHVDPKFRNLLAAFIELHGMPPEHALVNVPLYGYRFVNPADADYFAKFHDEHARTRELVCAPCNMAAERGS